MRMFCQEDTDRTIKHAEPKTTTSVTLRPGMTTAELVKSIQAAALDNGRPVELAFMGGGVDREGEQFVRFYFERIE